MKTFLRIKDEKGVIYGIDIDKIVSYEGYNIGGKRTVLVYMNSASERMLTHSIEIGIEDFESKLKLYLNP